jgi:hypothetical protein
MATNTEINVGVRHDFETWGARNFEPDTVREYLCNRQNLEWDSMVLDVGDALIFDGAGGVSYDADSLPRLEMFWNSGWLTPQV